MPPERQRIPATGPPLRPGIAVPCADPGSAGRVSELPLHRRLLASSCAAAARSLGPLPARRRALPSCASTTSTELFGMTSNALARREEETGAPLPRPGNGTGVPLPLHLERHNSRHRLQSVRVRPEHADTEFTRDVADGVQRTDAVAGLVQARRERAIAKRPGTTATIRHRRRSWLADRRCTSSRPTRHRTRPSP